MDKAKHYFEPIVLPLRSKRFREDPEPEEQNEDPGEKGLSQQAATTPSPVPQPSSQRQPKKLHGRLQPKRNRLNRPTQNQQGWMPLRRSARIAQRPHFRYEDE